MKGCYLCEHPEDESSVVLETPQWIVALSRDQRYLGRAALIAREHVASLSELSDAAWLDHARIVRKFERAAREAFGASMFNWSCFMNLGHPTPHVHWHVRPRYAQPVTLAGVTFVDEAFGAHYERAEREVDESVRLAIVGSLRKRLA